MAMSSAAMRRLKRRGDIIGTLMLAASAAVIGIWVWAALTFESVTFCADATPRPATAPPAPAARGGRVPEILTRSDRP